MILEEIRHGAEDPDRAIPGSETDEVRTEDEQQGVLQHECDAQCDQQLVLQGFAHRAGQDASLDGIPTANITVRVRAS